MVASKPSRPSDKRLSVDLTALRQLLWKVPSEEGYTVKDELTVQDSVQVRWIDTSRMVADPLTKKMNAAELDRWLSDGHWIWDATPESAERKRRAQEMRAKTKRVIPESE